MASFWNTTALFLEDNYLLANRVNLPDSQFSTLLKLKIVLNSNDGTLASVEKLLNDFFGGQITVVDNKDMTVSYSVSRLLPIPADVVAAYLPRPMGVGISVAIV